MKDLIPEECPRYEACGASLCPLDLKHLKIGCWYADEEYCNKTPVPNWVLMQRKIARRAKNKDGYFTYEMLKRNCKITGSIVGLDPDKEETEQLEKWFKLHSIKKEMSVAQKGIIASRFKEYKEKTKNDK